MKNRAKTFRLDLEAWQSRMIQDFLHYEKPVEAVTIKPGVIQCPASYKIPVDGLSWRDWVLYLTDKQMEIVQKQFALPLIRLWTASVPSRDMPMLLREAYFICSICFLLYL